MFKLAFKLAVAVLIANAAWRVGSAYASHYKFQDGVEQATQYGPDKGDTELKARVLELAVKNDVPLEETGFTVEHSLNHTIVDGAYVTQLELVPGYKRPWSFKFHVDTFIVR